MLTTTAWGMLIGTVQAEPLRMFRVKIASPHPRSFRDKKRIWVQNNTQSVSHRSALNAHQEQSETSRRLPTPLGAFVSTTLFLIVHTFISMELPESSSRLTAYLQ